MDETRLFRLLSWLSPSFPVGSYAYSHGIEFAVHAQMVRDQETLTKWLEGVLEYGTGRLDAIIFHSVYKSSTSQLDELVQLATVLKGTRELSQESLLQGRAFAMALESSWHSPRTDEFSSFHLSRDKVVPYAVAVALACKQNEIPPAAALTAYLHALASGLVSAGMRLIPLGQTDGQSVLAKLESTVCEVAAYAMSAPLSDLGTSTPILDWVSMQHEILHTRLFRS